MNAVVDGLPRSWQTAPSITVNRRGAIEIAIQLARAVDHHQRVNPDVAFGMPFRLLLAADERHASRAARCSTTPRSQRERESDRWPRRLQQQLLQFAPDPFGRQIVEPDPPAQFGGLLVERELEACGELHRAQHAQAVVAERRGSTTRSSRRSRSPRPSNGSTYSPVSGSHEIALMVKSRRRAASSSDMNGSPRTSKPLWPRPCFDSRRGSATSIADAIGPDNFVDRKALPDGLDATERGEQRGQRSRGDAEHFQVDVLAGIRASGFGIRTRARGTISHPAADDERTAAGVSHAGRDRCDEGGAVVPCTTRLSRTWCELATG